MRLKRFDNMNVVPFIDIILVILVIVLTTASFIQLGVIEVNLPSAKANNLKEIVSKDLNISIKRGGEIFFNREKVLVENLEKRLLDYNRSVNITIFCDRDAKFEKFVSLLDTLKSNGYENLGIMTKRDGK
jgi:biopolymer transport protein ExbD